MELARDLTLLRVSCCGHVFARQIGVVLFRCEARECRGTMCILKATQKCALHCRTLFWLLELRTWRSASGRTL